MNKASFHLYYASPSGYFHFFLLNFFSLDLISNQLIEIPFQFSLATRNMFFF